MSRIPHTIVAAVSTLAVAMTVPAAAGIADSPLPQLVAGKTIFHVYSVPSIISDAFLATYFGCTSTDTATT